MTEESRGQRKTLQGWVVSDRMAKTRVIKVLWRRRHPLYEKVMARKTKIYAHDETNSTRVGDHVLVSETRPLSRLKRWRITKVLPRTHDTGKVNPIGGR